MGCWTLSGFGEAASVRGREAIDPEGSPGRTYWQTNGRSENVCRNSKTTL